MGISCLGRVENRTELRLESESLETEKFIPESSTLARSLEAFLISPNISLKFLKQTKIKL
jgi:hypothetical protein